MRRVSLVSVFLFLSVVFAFVIRSSFLWRDFVFVFDQGRDALAVQKILEGNLTYIGPTTGLSGVFLGPLFYYLLVPMYWLGNGNPIVPAYIFVLLYSFAAVPIFLLAKKVAGTWAGVLAVFFFSFSFAQFLFSRWLSNPTPLPLTMLLLFAIFLRALETKKKEWFLATGLFLGACLQLEAANAFFLIPTLFLIAAIEYWIAVPKKQKMARFTLWVQALLRDRIALLFGVGGFAVTLLPQFLFEVKHGFISTKALIASFGSSQGLQTYSFQGRAALLFDLYAKGFFWRAPWHGMALLVLLLVCISIFVLHGKKLWNIQVFRVVFIWFCAPLVFHLLYRGNHGNFWDYYIIGQYIPLYILVASILVFAVKTLRGLPRVGMLVFVMLTGVFMAVPNAREWFAMFVPYNERISLSLQLDAVDWVYRQAQGEPFGVWSYTPSAQDDVYRYLFAYRGKRTGKLPVEHPENTKKMFLIVEDDPRNPKRREEWIKTMSAIGTVVTSKKFGAVTVFEIERKLEARN